MHGVSWAFSGRQGMCTVDDRDHRSHRVCVHELTGEAQGMTGETQEGTGKDREFSRVFSASCVITKQDDLCFVK